MISQQISLFRPVLNGLWLASLLLCAGCSKAPKVSENRPPVYPVEGMATVDGKPLTDAFIQLFPVESVNRKAAIVPRGFVDSEGKFRLTSFQPEDGAPAGEYMATISWKGPLEGVSESREEELPQRMPAELTRPQSSGLKVTVVEGRNAIAPWNISESQLQASIDPESIGNE